MGDVVGRLFRNSRDLEHDDRDFGVVSLTLTPMMCARLLRYRMSTSRTHFIDGLKRL
jgi:hypothetical protein